MVKSPPRRGGRSDASKRQTEVHGSHEGEGRDRTHFRQLRLLLTYCNISLFKNYLSKMSMKLRASELILSLKAVKRVWQSSATVTNGMEPIDMKRTCNVSSNWSDAAGNSFGFANRPSIQTGSVRCGGCGERWKKGEFSLEYLENIEGRNSNCVAPPGSLTLGLRILSVPLGARSSGQGA